MRRWCGRAATNETAARAVERTNEVLAEEAADFREWAREAGLEYLPGREPLEAGL